MVHPTPGTSVEVTQWRYLVHMWHLSAAVHYTWWTKATFTSTSWRCEAVCLQWMSKAFLYSSLTEYEHYPSI